MPTTRKKIIKTVYKDDDDSEPEHSGDFSDSGSEAHITDQSSSEDEDVSFDVSSSDEFKSKRPKFKMPICKPPIKRRPNPAKTLVNKIITQNRHEHDSEHIATIFSVKKMSAADKLLPPILNLSESDSSDDEQGTIYKNNATPSTSWSTQENLENIAGSECTQDNSEEIARQTFKQLEQHAKRFEETKTALENCKQENVIKNELKESNVKDLLSLGEEVVSPSTLTKKKRNKNVKDDSESDLEDWEEVKDSKPIPKQGIQLVVDFPDATYKKSKPVDVEMMMRRKINRVKKEYQIYMHKVHVLCWLGHGNYVSQVLNHQEVMSAALSLVPSKTCYPGDRVDLKYVEQIITWYKDKMTLKQDKNEHKYKPKAPPLKNILIAEAKSRIVTTKKHLVFLFVSMLRALGIKCRIMFNFVTLPLKPPSSELCSLSTKQKQDTQVTSSKKEEPKKKSTLNKKTMNNNKVKHEVVPQLDGNFDDYLSNEDCDNIMQLDGNNDIKIKRAPSRTTQNKNKCEKGGNEDDNEIKIKRVSSRAINSKYNSLEVENQVGKDINIKKAPSRNIKSKSKCDETDNQDDISPPKRVRRSRTPNISQIEKTESTISTKAKISNKNAQNSQMYEKSVDIKNVESGSSRTTTKSPRKTRLSRKCMNTKNLESSLSHIDKNSSSSMVPNIIITSVDDKKVSSEFFKCDRKDIPNERNKTLSLSRKRSHTSTSNITEGTIKASNDINTSKLKKRTKSAPSNVTETSEYFPVATGKKNYKKQIANAKPHTNMKETKVVSPENKLARNHVSPTGTVKVESNKYISNSKSHSNDLKSKDSIKKSPSIDSNEVKKRIVRCRAPAGTRDCDELRVSHRELTAKSKLKEESDDSDYNPEENTKAPRHGGGDNDFQLSKSFVKSPILETTTTRAKRRIDRRVLSSDDETAKKERKIDVWCEVFVEELEQWITVDVVKAQFHCANQVHTNATHPVAYIVGWDNNNRLKDLTRRYVPHWNTVTRKLRVSPIWWDEAIYPWIGPRTAKDCEEDEYLNKIQVEAPLPKSIAEYKNHPLYALKRHLLKFEAIYPPDPVTLGFVRGEAVYARDCVYTCRSRDTWLKEAKVVRLGEKPYKVVKARPKWDKLSNKAITDRPLEVFGPWQVQDYEPPVAENGVVPRNAYGNVELFKMCMLPKGTVHVKLPGLNKVARKLNIDCAPAMTGFDFNGGWSHPVYDGFVVCEEFGEIITEAWAKDQEEQERKEKEKIEIRVYGNWKKLIKGLLIRERLKHKYGFDTLTAAKANKKKSKGPRLVVKK